MHQSLYYNSTQLNKPLVGNANSSNNKHSNLNKLTKLMRSKPTLPQPDQSAQQHSQTLSTHIQKVLKRHNSLSFAQFMQLALYTPGLGYYANGLPKIGAQGDFITAPEISPLFSQCLARQAAQVLQTLTTPNIIEFGAGRGTMARDILQTLDHIDVPIQNYYIIELSADLKAKQAETLSTLPDALKNKVVWLDTLPNKPLPAVVLANEVMDAMPIERLKLEPERSSKGFVIFNETTQQFEWDYQTLTDPALQKFANRLLRELEPLDKQGYETEINLNIAPWLQSISDFLTQGLVLLIDYGYVRREYYQPARNMGTLRCHYQHLAHDNPFFYPGLQDITAHVDFTAVAEGGFDAGFKVAGFTTQAHFLMGSGLLEMGASADAPISEQIKNAQQIKTLTLPDEMGESFKVMALTKDIEFPLMGFQFRDLRHQL